MSVRPPRVIFLGMRSNFSYPSLQALLAAGVNVCSVILPGERNTPDYGSAHSIRRLDPPQRTQALLPVLHSHLHTSVEQIAWKQAIPLWEVTRMGDADTQALVREYQPDALCVSCFSLYIPRAVLDIPRLGTLNVHPSLLPDNRGPDPLFWTFRRGDHKTGVTIHFMDEGLDTGPILAQEELPVPDGITYAELESRSALLGGNLLAHTLWHVYRGAFTSTPQDEALSNYLPMPTDKDFAIIPDEWSARHLFNFVCGVKDWGRPLLLHLPGKEVVITSGISYAPENKSEGNFPLGTWEEIAHQVYRVRCRDGWAVLQGSSQ